MQLPTMKSPDRLAKTKQLRFRGLNHTLGARDGDIWDMMNMTSDHYPVLATRPKRMKLRTLSQPGGLFAMNGLCWVDGESFLFNGEEKGRVSAGQKRFGALGDYIIILPDKCCYNVKTGVFQSMEAQWSAEKLTFGNGLLYGVEADANMIRCEGVSWKDWFREGDAVTISGCTVHPENNVTDIIRGIDGDKLYFYENVFTLEAGAEYTEEGALKVERTVPDLEQICENESRLWGRSGNTIYASKPRDIFNWNVYDGLESDAWAVECGSAGEITGCISFRGFPSFFKEENIYKVYGSLPSEFDVMGSASMGLPEGNGDSLAIAGETLFYLGRSGVMGYTGGIPQLVSSCFGTQRFRKGVAGSDGFKYYISMQDEDGVWWLYVYDTQKRMWHKEDRTKVTHFARYEGNLYYLNSKGEIWITGNIQNPPADAVPEEQAEYMVEFTDFTEDDPNAKSVGKIQLRIDLGEDSYADIHICYDSNEGPGNWELIKSIGYDNGKGSQIIPVAPRRADHYRIRISGKGECKIYSMAREFYTGSGMKTKRGWDNSGVYL